MEIKRWQPEEEVEDIFWEEEYEELRQKFQLAESRHKLFNSIYYSILYDLQYFDDEDRDSYEEIVIAVCTDKANQIDTTPRFSIESGEQASLDQNANLRQLADELGIAYRLEANLHFLEFKDQQPAA